MNKTVTQEIELVQVPKIAHRLQELGKKVTDRLAELNLGQLVANEETVKALKSLRADLNKELENYEEQRKFVKNGILNPYNEFEGIYKNEIADKYREAIDTLKDKIAQVETKVKTEKRDHIKSYFDELCLAEKIDFIPFDRAGIEINLSTSEKAYREKCDEFVKKVTDDLALIYSTEISAEVLTEYKSNLNASLSITTVRTRKENERIEAERIYQAEVLRRKNEVVKSGLIFDDFSKTYIFNDEVFITTDFIEQATKGDFTKKLIECQEKIKEFNLKPSDVQSEMKFADPASKQTGAITAPTVRENTTEETVTASFRVTGTMAQLRALGQYMRDNQIKYQNI